MKKIESFKSKETETRKLAYDVDFRAWMKEHPGVLKTFLETVRSEEFKKAQKGDVIERGEIRVSFPNFGRPTKNPPMFFKLELDGGKFFIKIETKTQERGYAWGHKEFVDAQKARQLLEGLSGVEVYEPQLGYQTEKESFFVSKWIDLPTLTDYLEELRPPINQSSGLWDKDELWYRLSEKFSKIQERLIGFFDITERNVFYDSETDTIILFDISKDPDSWPKDTPRINFL